MTCHRSVHSFVQFVVIGCIPCYKRNLRSSVVEYDYRRFGVCRHFLRHILLIDILSISAARRDGSGAFAKAFPVRASCRYIKIHLVDPASSHMLVSKTKPCMSQYKS